MAEKSHDNLRAVLRKRISDFLGSETAHRRHLKPLLHEIRRRGRRAYLFGGTLRDLMLHGLGKSPRDLDIVVAELRPDLYAYLQPNIRRQTRFGGIEVTIGHWDLDIWQLSSTWAFREGLIQADSFQELPRTTFLNVQAVAVEIGPSPKKPGRIVEHGFFQAVANRTIDINLQHNPFPGCCLLSALATAYKLDFAISPRLIRYIIHHGSKVDFQALCDYQARRYGRVMYGRDLLRSWIAHLRDRHREEPDVAARLPKLRGVQHTLPWTCALEMDTVTMPNDDDWASKHEDEFAGAQQGKNQQFLPF